MKQKQSYSVNDLTATKKIANDLSFISDVDDVDIYPRPKDVDYISAKAKVYWSLEIEARESGIKSIYITIDKIEINGIYEYEAEVGDVAEEEDFTLTITGEDWNIKEDISQTLLSQGANPTLVNIDTNKKTVTVDFY